MEKHYGSFDARHQVTRRKILKASIPAAISLMLVAYGLSRSDQSDPTITPVPVQLPPDGQLDNQMEESIRTNEELFESYSLQPVEFTDADDPGQRVGKAVSYLSRYVQAVSEPVRLPRTILSAYHIVDKDNFPIDLESVASAHDAVTKFMTATDLDRSHEEPSLTVHYDPNAQGGTAGAWANYELVSGRWVPRVTIGFSSAIMTPGDRFEEGRRDNPLTDGELAAMLVHEGHHYLQILAIAARLNQSPEVLQQIGDSQEAVKAWVVETDDAERRRVQQIISGRFPQFEELIGASDPVEAQANAGMFAWYDTLQGLNDGVHVYGMGQLDPPGNEYSLYGRYKKYVLGDSALSPLWLIEAGKSV